METFTEKQGCEIISIFVGKQVKRKTFDCCIEAMKTYSNMKDSPKILDFSVEEYYSYCTWRNRFNVALTSYDIKQVFILTVSAIKWFIKTTLKYG